MSLDRTFELPRVPASHLYLVATDADGLWTVVSRYRHYCMPESTQLQANDVTHETATNLFARRSLSTSGSLPFLTRCTGVSAAMLNHPPPILSNTLSAPQSDALVRSNWVRL